MSSMLCIDAPHFVAAIEFDEQDIAVKSTPILWWAVDRQMTMLGMKRWATKKGYAVHEIRMNRRHQERQPRQGTAPEEI